MRLFIYPTDISDLTGKSPNTGRTIYKKILNKLGKTKEEGLTIEEYCKETKLDESKVIAAINSKSKGRIL